jgi:hypothetical protein
LDSVQLATLSFNPYPSKVPALPYPTGLPADSNTSMQSQKYTAQVAVCGKNSPQQSKREMHTLSLQLHHCLQPIELYFARLELRFASSMLETQKFALQHITYSHHAYDVMRCQNA